MDVMGYSLATIFGLAFLGFAVGTFGTLIGAGGGFLLAPALLLLYPHERPETITAISLAVVFFNAASGSVAYAQQKRIDYRSGLYFALASVPGTLLGAYTTGFIPRQTFNLVFGCLLFVLGWLVFFNAKQKLLTPQTSDPKATTHCHLVDRHGEEYRWSYSMRLGVAISLGVGYLSSLLGIGGGIIHVPALARVLHFPVRIATATSHFILALVALMGTVAHIALGAFAHGSRRTVFLSLGVVLGAQLGAHLSHRIQGTWILRALANALCLVGLRLLFLH